MPAAQRTAAALACLTATGALVGCGAPDTLSASDSAVTAPSPIEGMLPEQILRKTDRAARGARSVTLSGSLTAQDGPRSYRFHLTERGLSGYVTTSRFGSVDLVATKDRVFLRAGADLYGQLLKPEQAASATGKWLEISPRIAKSAGLLQWTDKDEYLDTLLEPQRTARLEKVPRTDSEDGSSVGLTEPGTGTLWVALEGKPYPVRVDPADPDLAPVMLTEWDMPVSVEAPATEDTVVMKPEAARPG